MARCKQNGVDVCDLSEDFFHALDQGRARAVVINNIFLKGANLFFYFFVSVNGGTLPRSPSACPKWRVMRSKMSWMFKKRNIVSPSRPVAFTNGHNDPNTNTDRRNCDLRSLNLNSATYTSTDTTRNEHR